MSPRLQHSRLPFYRCPVPVHRTRHTCLFFPTHSGEQCMPLLSSVLPMPKPPSTFWHNWSLPSPQLHLAWGKINTKNLANYLNKTFKISAFTPLLALGVSSLRKDIPLAAGFCNGWCLSELKEPTWEDSHRRTNAFQVGGKLTESQNNAKPRSYNSLKDKWLT